MRMTCLKPFQPVLLFFTLCCNVAYGQADFKKNDVYIEAGGSGIIYSLNYERQLFRKPGLGVRAGVGWFPHLYRSFPFGINYLFDISHSNFIEAGAGVTTRKSYIHWGRTYSYFVPSVGFRRHTSKNLLLRFSVLGAVERYRYDKRFGFYPWVGLSVGKRF